MAALLVLVSLYDLFSPPVNALIFRQTQTAMLTENFVRSGFHVSGLTVNVAGPNPALLVVEFPLYNAIVGGLFTLFGSMVLVGKLVSLACAVLSLVVLWKIVEPRWGRDTAALASLFFIFTPEGMLVRTAFTPDSIALLFTLCGVLGLQRWREAPSIRSLLAWNIAFLVAGLVKFPTLVPFIPACMYAALTVPCIQGERIRWRIPTAIELLVFLFVFLAPFVGWYVYRADMIYEPWRHFAGWENFFIGDLRRFLQPSYYPAPVYAFFAYAVCGSGILLIARSLKPARMDAVLLAAGIPLFYIVIPTVRYQHHYLYALAPWLAVLMALGWQALPGNSAGRTARLLIGSVYGFLFLVGSSYVLRHDNVVLRSAAALNESSAPDDLAVGLFLHDRNYLGSELHPELFYLSGRHGWNVGYAGQIPPASIDSVVTGYRSAGATRLVVTTYDPSLEPWFARWIPAALRRNPRYDTQTVISALDSKYKRVSTGENFLVFKL